MLRSAWLVANDRYPAGSRKVSTAVVKAPLANAIEDAGIERAKAERVASVIVDLVHDSVATKADVQALGGELRADIAASEASVSLAATGQRGGPAGRVLRVAAGPSRAIARL